MRNRARMVLGTPGVAVLILADGSPLTKFVPWAAYVRLRDQDGYVLDQLELFDALSRQPSTNPDQTSFDAAIHAMASAEEIKLPPVN
jgi:hypothetical protein